MSRYRILYLLLSSCSLLAIGLSSCAIGKYRRYPPSDSLWVTAQDVRPIIPADGQSHRYRASIDVLNHHFSGIVIMKQTDSLTQHLVFVTELGMQMLDFRIQGGTIQPAYVFEPLNKPALINSLNSDFEAMLLLPLYGRKTQVLKKDETTLLKVQEDKERSYIRVNNRQPVSSEVFQRNKRRIRIRYGTNADTIRLKQYGLVKLRMELTKMPGNP